MNVLANILLLCIVLCCVLKTSLWHRWPRLVFGGVLGGLAWWATDVAASLSKTRLLGILQQPSTLQDLTVGVTLEAVLGIAYCMNVLDSDSSAPSAYGFLARGRVWWRRLLLAYPCLLVVPALFCLQAQVLFLMVGADFSTMALAFGAGTALLFPLVAEALSRLLPQQEQRIELFLLLTVLSVVLCLLLMQLGPNAPRPTVIK